MATAQESKASQVVVGVTAFVYRSKTDFEMGRMPRLVIGGYKSGDVFRKAKDRTQDWDDRFIELKLKYGNWQKEPTRRPKDYARVLTDCPTLC